AGPKTYQLWAIMKWRLTVMLLHMAGPGGSMMPECVTTDLMRHQIRQDGTRFRRAESEGL
ncbi:MAG: hypothetical protein WCA23_11155, partial [Stellaceae bacterium]